MPESQRHHGREPCHGIFTRLSQPQGQVQLLRNLQVLLQGADIRRTAVAMEMNYHVFIVYMVKNPRIGCPVNALQGNQVVSVMAADTPDRLYIEVAQPGRIDIQVGISRKADRPDRLIQQVIAAHNPPVMVPPGNLFPQVQAAVKLCVIDEQPAKVIHGIIDIRTGLAAGGAVQVNKGIQPVFLAPVQQAVNQLKSIPAELGFGSFLHQEPGRGGNPQ